MLRRTRLSSISAYEFGHPPMMSNFSKEVYPNPKPLTWDAVKRTILNNGIKVVSQDRKGQMSSVGFFVEAGAKFDPMTAPGLSSVMRYAALTSNSSESLFQLDRAMRSVGAAYANVEVNKRHLGWTAEVAREHWKIPVEKLQNCFVVPRFAESDIERFRDTMDNQLEEKRWQNPREYCEEMLETVAFFKEPLGNPRSVQPQDNDNCSSAQLLKQYCRYFAPQRMTISAINVDHNELISYYSTLPFQLSSSAPHFSEALLESSAAVDEAKQFTGLKEGFKAEARAKEMGTHPHMDEDGTLAIGWLTYGADTNLREYATSLVCRGIIDASFSDCLRTNRSAVHFGHRSFYRPYSSAGLLGITFRGPLDARLQEEYKKILASGLPATGKVAQPDVTRGANRAALNYYTTHLENQRDALSTLATATFESDVVLAELQKVTVDDVNKAFAGMKKNKPVSFGTGLVHDFPSLRSLSVEMGF